MVKKRFSIGARLARTNLVIENAKSDDVIRKALARYNYDEVRFQEGLKLYQRVRELIHQKSQAHSDKDEATDILHEKMKKLKKKYREHLELARLCLNNEPSAVEMLVLGGKRKRRTAGWMMSASFIPMPLVNQR